MTPDKQSRRADAASDGNALPRVWRRVDAPAGFLGMDMQLVLQDLQSPVNIGLALRIAEAYQFGVCIVDSHGVLSDATLTAHDDRLTLWTRSKDFDAFVRGRTPALMRRACLLTEVSLQGHERRVPRQRRVPRGAAPVPDAAPLTRERTRTWPSAATRTTSPRSWKTSATR